VDIDVAIAIYKDDESDLGRTYHYGPDLLRVFLLRCLWILHPVGLNTDRHVLIFSNIFSLSYRQGRSPPCVSNVGPMGSDLRGLHDLSDKSGPDRI